MIEFYGECSSECKLDRHERNNLFLIKALICFIVVLCTPFIIFALIRNELTAFYTAIVLAVSLCIVFIGFIITPMSKRTFIDDVTRVIIEKGNITYIPYQNPKAKKVISVAKVKKVIDKDEWYYLVFGIVQDTWICEKKLLTKGTIEEFEKLFEGKIIKKSVKVNKN